MEKYRAGDICPRTATWGLFRDGDDETYDYTGSAYDRYVRKGWPFPELKPGCHYRIMTGLSEPAPADDRT